MAFFQRLFGKRAGTQPSTARQNSRSAKTQGPPDGETQSFRDYDAFRRALDCCQCACDASEWSERFRPGASVDAKVKDIFSRRDAYRDEDDGTTRTLWIEAVWYKNNPARLKRIDGCIQVQSNRALDHPLLTGRPNKPFISRDTLWSDPSLHLGSAPR
jgi:hypothetical protein